MTQDIHLMMRLNPAIAWDSDEDLDDLVMPPGQVRISMPCKPKSKAKQKRDGGKRGNGSKPDSSKMEHLLRVDRLFCVKALISMSKSQG